MYDAAASFVVQALKWNFNSPRAEFVEQLKSQMEATVSAGLMEKLYHKDFKQHIKGIEVLMKVMGHVMIANANFSNW